MPWLGEVPKHWEVKRNKLLLREVVERSEHGSENLLSVSQYTGVTRRSDRHAGAGGLLTNAVSLVGYKRVLPGDLVMNIMLAWNGSLGASSVEGIVSPAYCVFRAIAGVEPRFFHYLLRTPLLTGVFKSVSTGVVDSRLRLYPEVFFRLPTVLPPLPEQAGIVRFLDHADRRIRRYIATKKKLVALLDEQQQAVIHHAVTRGRNPNVRLKPSGVEWLGGVPEQWEVGPVGGLCEYISYGFTNPMPAADQGPYMLTANDIGDGAIRFEDARRTTQDAFDHLLTKKSRPIRGDVLVTKDGTLGRVAVADGRPACINQSVALLRVDADRVLPEFLAAILRGPLYRERMTYEAGGSTIKHIYIVHVPMPNARLTLFGRTRLA